MYVLQHSLLQHTMDYRVEVYNMEVLGYEALTSIDLKIIGEDGREIYLADYIIERADGKVLTGSCANQPTKEAMIELVEQIVIDRLQNENSHWK